MHTYISNIYVSVMKCNWMRNLDQPIVVIVAIFSCCRCNLLWSCCGGSRCDWFEGLPVQPGEGTPLSCSACPLRDARIMCCCIVCAGVSWNRRQITQFLQYNIYFLASCWVFVFSCFVLRPYIYSALIRFIITFHFYSARPPHRLSILIM